MTTHPATLGRFFEDYAVGDVYQHPLGRTITETDNTWITNLTLNTNQNHFNTHLAQQNPITDGKVLVNSGLTIAMVLGLSVLDMSQNAVANLEFTDVALTHPLYVGDTIYAERVHRAAQVQFEAIRRDRLDDHTGHQSARRRHRAVEALGHGRHA